MPSGDPQTLAEVVPLSKTALLDELQSVKKILVRWEKSVEGIREGEPMDADEVTTQMRNLAGEMMLASAKLSAIAQVIAAAS